jgi:hypothetical protein
VSVVGRRGRGGIGDVSVVGRERIDGRGSAVPESGRERIDGRGSAVPESGRERIDGGSAKTFSF